jgi:hypothetical protein
MSLTNIRNMRIVRNIAYKCNKHHNGKEYHLQCMEYHLHG